MAKLRKDRPDFRFVLVSVRFEGNSHEIFFKENCRNFFK